MAQVVITRDEITEALTRLSAALSDMKPAYEEIGQILTRSTKKRFGDGIAPDGSRWAPKSPVTLTKYGARTSNRIDVRPLFGPSGALSSQIFYQASPEGVEWGSPMIYAATQQFGAAQGAFGRTARNGPIPWGTIPARPFLGLSPQDETSILDTLSEWLQRAATSG
jgi:phage virion morphogenesis protein